MRDHRNVAAVDRTVDKTMEWLDELDEALGWDDRQQAWSALGATLHALRDRLPIAEAADLAAQLPLLVRGLFYEGWVPTAVPVKVRRAEEFLAPIGDALSRERATDPEDVARAVFALLDRRVSEGEMADVRHVLPQELRGLFAAPAAA